MDNKEWKGKVKIVYNHNPLGFHKQAMVAAEAAYEAFVQKGNRGFWNFYEKLFEKQGQLRKEGRALLETIAKDMGLNMTKFKAALDKHTHQPAIQKQQQLARSLGAMGTPTFFINGRKLRGARPFPAFKALIDEELKKAEKAVKERKATVATYYGTVMKTGLTKVKYLPGSAPPPQRRRKVVDPTVVFHVPVKGKPWAGAKDALVTIVESSEFQ